MKNEGAGKTITIDVLELRNDVVDVLRKHVKDAHKLKNVLVRVDDFFTEMVLEKLNPSYLARHGLATSRTRRPATKKKHGR